MDKTPNATSAAPPQALRQQALDLLLAAEQLDKLKPFAVTHVHKHGESNYLVWAEAQPVQADLAQLIPHFEPEREEYLSVSPVAPLNELVGLAYVVASDAEASIEDDRGQLPADDAAYLKAGGCRCPFCGSEDIVGEGVEIDEGGANQEVSCSTCDKTWYDDYKLTGFREIN